MFFYAKKAVDEIWAIARNEAKLEKLRNDFGEKIITCKAAAVLCSICIPYMKSGDMITNIASQAASQQDSYLNMYAATKAFLRSYSRSLNVEFEGTGITVTAVCPGWVDTEMLNKEINGQKAVMKTWMRSIRRYVQ